MVSLDTMIKRREDGQQDETIARSVRHQAFHSLNRTLKHGIPRECGRIQQKIKSDQDKLQY